MLLKNNVFTDKTIDNMKSCRGENIVWHYVLYTDLLNKIGTGIGGY